MELNKYFDFSRTQLRFLMVLAGLLVVLSIYYLIRAYAIPAGEPIDLKVFAGDDKSYAGTFVLDPNSAPADSLELLPGIGPVLADRIVEYRNHRRFETALDIINVPGIGPRLYQRISPYLRVRPE